MSIGDIIEVRSEDIQAFVESQMSSGKPKPTGKQTEKTISANNSQTFTVTRNEYIEFLVNQRESQISSIKRSQFWGKVWAAVLWVIKFILGIVLFIGVLLLFYLLVWFMQQVLIANHMAITTIP